MSGAVPPLPNRPSWPGHHHNHNHHHLFQSVDRSDAALHSFVRAALTWHDNVVSLFLPHRSTTAIKDITTMRVVSWL